LGSGGNPSTDIFQRVFPLTMRSLYLHILLLCCRAFVCFRVGARVDAVDPRACGDASDSAGSNLLQVGSRFENHVVVKDDKDESAATKNVNEAAARGGIGSAASTTLDVKTVGWRPEDLKGVRELLQSGAAPSWATEAKEALVRQAKNRVGLPAGLRKGVPAGPWSVIDEGPEAPSGDARDYRTTGGYIWPCTTLCNETGYDAYKCQFWDEKLRTFGKCNESTGLPWVSRDGFMNMEGEQDLGAMIVMADTVEILTLAWWFAPDDAASSQWVNTATQVIRRFFINSTTRMNPRLPYASAIPGHYEGTAGGVIAPTFRLNSRIIDSIELLRTSNFWTEDDDNAWTAWATDWLHWLRTSAFGAIELGAKGNHATYFMLHKIALAHAIGDTAVILEEVGRIDRGLAGSLCEQITVSGEMPVETNRIMGAIYSRMNLEALFKLGVVVENACRGMQCSWDWNWEVSESTNSRWEAYPNQISYCRFKGKGSLTSLEACKASCKDKEDCNGIVARFKTSRAEGDESLMGCYFKKCYGEEYVLKDQAPGSVSYDTHMLVEGPTVGTGSVRKALDYLLPYALGTKSWKHDYPTSVDFESTWRTMAVPLRIAANAYSDQSYEEAIAHVDPQGWFRNTLNSLVFPPVSSMSGE